MYEHTTTVRVRYAETDQMDIVYYGNYAQYFEVGRAESIRDLGFTYKKMEEMGVHMPVVQLEVRYLRPAHYDDLITIKTMLKSLPEDHEITFYNEVYNEKNKLLTTGKVTLYFINSETGKRTQMPEALKAALLPYFQD
ncbi:MAG: acyl-CoA thioesterase [Chitinophagaceae bacterium]|jgi:acyl-CoA thioester hydrolase|nr:acyl-CoA thioesterase [Chitinophagaceae bacterium]